MRVGDSQRIPALNVNIDLSNAGLWNTYGVSGYGMCRIFDREQRIPDNFAYTERTFTGYGGVMPSTASTALWFLWREIPVSR